jgi:hypothetical protein
LPDGFFGRKANFPVADKAFDVRDRFAAFVVAHDDFSLKFMDLDDIELRLPVIGIFENFC